jgi:hypothetical protein
MPRAASRRRKALRRPPVQADLFEAAPLFAGGIDLPGCRGPTPLLPECRQCARLCLSAIPGPFLVEPAPVPGDVCSRFWHPVHGAMLPWSLIPHAP